MVFSANQKVFKVLGKLEPPNSSLYHQYCFCSLWKFIKHKCPEVLELDLMPRKVGFLKTTLIMHQ